MKNFKSKIKQVLAIILSSAMLLGNVNVYAVDSIILKEEKYDEFETLATEESTEASIIEETEIESINSESEVNESNSTESEEANDNAIISTNSLDEFSNEVAALVSEDTETDSTYATKRLIVLSNTSDFDTYNAVSTISYDNLYILSYDTEKDCKKAYKALSGDSTIISVEADTIVKSVGSIQIDSYDNLENTDIKYSKLSAFLRMQPTDKNIVKVAILDSGIDLNAKEFTNKIINLNLNYSNSGTPNSIIDDYGHGTNIASIIAQHTYSNVKLMPIKITNNEGKGSILSLYMGIESAIQNNANVINISLSCYSTKDSAIINAAIDKAVSKGIIVVTSAGNDNANTKSYIPANNDNVFTISSVNKNLQKSNFSNYGDNVDYCMLGEGISCLGLESSYATYSGTSYSTALFTSIVSQLKACDLSYTKDNIVNILNNYIYDIGDTGKDIYFGNGLLSYDAIVKNNGNEQIDDTIIPELNINDVDNWKELSNEKLQDYIFYGSYKNNAYFIQNLSKEDLEYVLKKDTDLVKDVNYDDYDGLYYKYLMSIDLSEVESNAVYVASSGYIFFNINGGPNGNSRIRINMSINKSSNGNAQQTVTWSLPSGYTNNHSFALTKTSSKSQHGKNGSNKAADYDIFVCKCQYTIPANYHVSSATVNKNSSSSLRMNFKEYNVDNNGNSTVDYGVQTTSARIDTLTLQINASFTGIEKDNANNTPHGEYTINLIHDHTAYLHDSSNATCTSASTENYYCSTCGAYLSTTHNTAALGHTWPGYWSYDGSNHWQICGRAGDAYMYNPEAHKFVASVIRNATCTTKGVHRYTCSTCGYYYDSEDIAKTAHTPYLHDSTAATCTSASTENYYCSRCGVYLSTTHNTPALGHSWPSDFSYADSNNVTNGMAYKNCTRCGTRLDTQYKVQLFRSTYGDVIASSVNTSTGKIWYHAGDSVTVIGSALDGFVWTGWSGDGYDIQSSSQTYTFTMPAKAVRGWGRANYYSSTLTINPNGGSWNGSTNTQSFTQNRGTTKSIPNPTRTGYTFAGWTKSSAFTAGSLNGTTFTFGSSNGGTGTLTASWSANPYTVTYIDVVDSTSGKQLNKTTKQVNYATSVRGSELGSNTTDNTYYKGYYYVSDTSATVGVNGATVYRIFKQRMSTVSGNIIWEDWNNKNSSRPDSVTLHINGSDGKTYVFTIKGDNSKNTSTNTWSYNEQVPKYDSNGNIVTYTVSQNKAISKEEGLAYKNPVVNGYDITNSISANPSDVPVKPNISITTYIQWQDNNNQYGFRPTGISLDLLQNGNVIQSINTSSDSYTFEKLYKYDENGNLYKYTVSSNDVDRYNKTIDNEYYTITYTFQAPTYSVIIPKTVVLDGINGIGKYTVSVKGNIDNRDFIKVIPDNSFTMKNAYLSPITAIVQQEVTSFTNQNNIKSGAKTTGTITAKSLAGKWSGNFNFNIYFEFGK